MTITTTFSNGFTDTYKGDRDVKAAWAIIEKLTGKAIASGHSIDAVRAEKTAQQNLRDFTFESAPELCKPVTKFQSKKVQMARKKHNEQVMATRRAAVTIEVIDL